jgi:miniconductance mechanosensitive channel
MEESDGRRIKRAINVKQSSVRFCNPQMLARFKKNPLLTEYIETKQIELDAYNAEIERTGKGVRKEFTNLGLFRVYLKNYLLQNPEINKNLSLIVRQLSPTDKGVPVEIYCFSKDKVWSDYETVQSDIFDHVFASIHLFDLEIFESPSHENDTTKAIDASESD